MRSRHTPYYQLLEALDAPYCAFCHLARAAIDRYLDGMLYESVNRVDTQEMLKAAHGFCPSHSELLLGQRSAMGIAILYNAVLGQLLTELPAETATEGMLERLSRRLPGNETNGSALAASRPCPACERRDQVAGRAIEVLNIHHDEPELVVRLNSSRGLCLPHLRSALPALNRPARRLVAARQRQVWDGLREELAELIRKNDYRFRDETFGAEADAWQRAVRATTGEPGVF